MPASKKRAASASELVAPRKSPRLLVSRAVALDAAGTQARGEQTYGITTLDALFKHVLIDDAIRASFFRAFIPGLSIISSTRLDDFMNPVQELQLLRALIHHQDTAASVSKISDATNSRHTKSCSNKSCVFHDSQVMAFLSEFFSRFDDIKKSFPKAKYNGTMDYACRLDNGDFSLVEMQVLPQNDWDKRALAYAAAFYGNQLVKGQRWSNLKKVIGINILGGGIRNEAHWKQSPKQFMRHYKFQEQLHKRSTPMFIDGIELIQYSVMNAPPTLPSCDQEQRDWITFFKRGAQMNEEQVTSEVRTQAVLSAFQRAKLSSLPDQVKQDYDAQQLLYDQVSDYTAEKVAEGEAKGEAKGRADATTDAVRGMKLQKFSNEDIARILKLTVHEVAAINNK
jgi:predicted transposase/invertase (TIGR01784 family)